MIKNIRRTHEEREEQETSNKHITRDSSQFDSKNLLIHFPIQVEEILYLSYDYMSTSVQYLNWKLF